MRNTSIQSGFSLIETLVAITILLLVIIGPLSISSSSVQSSAFASEQVTAFFLAQEGLELAQMARDQLMLQHFDNPASRQNPWTDFQNANGIFRLCYGSNGCGLSITNDTVGSLATIRNCNTASNCSLNLDTTTTGLRAKFTHGTVGATTPYRRVIRFTRVSPQEVSVTSTVTWQSGFSREEQRVVVQTSLFNIYGTN